MVQHSSIVAQLDKARREDLLAAAAAYRATRPTVAVRRPGRSRRWIGGRVVALRRLIAAQQATR
jgi:hypothetical protein